MNKYIKLFLIVLAIISSSCANAKKCKNFNSLSVKCQARIHDLVACGATVGGVPFGSLTAYAYAANETDQTEEEAIPNGADLIFNSATSLSSSNVTFGPSSPLFTTITVPPGTYFFAYSVSAIGANFAGDLLSFALFNHTANVVVPNSQYNSEQGLANPLLTKGFGIATFSSTTVLSLRNLSGQPIILKKGLPAGTSVVVDSLILIRIAA